jgi:hypothetical protein
MEALIRINGDTTIKVDAETTDILIQKLTEVRESIGHEPCGKCNSSNVYPNHRQVGEDHFYELKCTDCNAFLQLGKNKAEGTLYKKRMTTDSKGKALKDDKGNAIYKPNKGWAKWNPETKVME